MPIPLYILETSAAGLIARVVFNGILLAQDTLTAPLRRAEKVNAWAVSGENSVEVRLSLLPPSPAGALAAGRPEPSFTLRLREAVPGQPDASDRLLINYRWQADPPLTLVPATVMTRGVTLTAPVAWSWTRAQQIPVPSVIDQNAIADLLRKLHTALATKAIDDVVAIQVTQLDEQADALGLSRGDMRSAYRDFLDERMRQEDWTVAPFDSRGLRVQTMADGRVQHATSASGGPPIVATAAGSAFAIDPFLSKITGHWSIVR